MEPMHRKWSVRKHASVDSSSFDFVALEFGNLRAGSKTHMADASLVCGSQLTSPWRQSSPVVQLVTMTKATTKRGNFSFTTTSRLAGGLTCGHRRRLSRDDNGACFALNWMHGEDSRSAARPPSPVATEDRADVQERVILAAMRWVDAASAVDEHEVLAF